MMKVIAIGNRIMGDDGVALYVLEEIKNEIKKLNSEIEVIIGETDFVYCLNKINDHDFVIIVDSTYLGFKIGKVTLFSFEEAKRYLNHTASQHEISLIHIITNYKIHIRGYLIGIEACNIDFSLNLSDHLQIIFKDICSEVLNKIKIKMGEFNA
ncbi:hydrogenase maturation protease [Anaerophilus nitritogenes]|uniref:hydrogenase maturation protease n=1 Tax=Anaerophilus nitritogenes TaxID=2498136 RepID=UPI00101B5F87|nr:hydrogenase maturation protease [Anaerophilus nitritogenes]